MNLFFALVFWLAFLVFLAAGVHHLWTAVLGPKLMSIILLPGTLAAQIGRTLALVFTGRGLGDAAVPGFEPSGERNPRSSTVKGLGAVSSLLISFLPIGLCLLVILLLTRTIGRPVVSGLAGAQTAPPLPLSIPGTFDLLYDQVSLAESTARACWVLGLSNWRSILFLYVLTGLALRAAPIDGINRATLGAVIILAAVITCGIALSNRTGLRSEHVWSAMNMTLGVQLLLGLFGAMVHGLLGLIRLLKGRASRSLTR